MFVPILSLVLLLVLSVPVAARDQMTLGVSNPDGTPWADDIENALDKFVILNDGIEPAIYSVWSQWGSRGGQSACTEAKGSCYFPSDTLQMLHGRGIQGMVWWEPIDPTNQLAQKYARHKRTYQKGHNDAYIKEWARQAREFGEANDTKVLLRFAHEANGTWFPWTVGTFDNTPKTFKKYWRYVYNKFKGQGALPYVDFVWSVTIKSCKGCNPYAKIYPGNAFVDYAGLTAFNWGKQRRWKSMKSIVTKPLKQMWAVTKKPVIISELASHYRPTSKSKAAWLRNGYTATYNNWNRVKAIMYLNSDQPKQEFGHPDWRLSKPGDGSAQQAYAALSKKYKFKGTLLP